VSLKVAVVGAGIVGLNVALVARRRGLEVEIFDESNDVGRGASGHTAGVLHVLQLPFSSWKSKLALKGNPIYDKLSEELGFKLLRLPALLVYKNQLERMISYAVATFLRIKKLDVKVISKNDVKDLCPDVSKKVAGAIMVNGYGTVIPSDVLRSFANKLEKEGVKIRFGEKVLSLRDNKRRVVVASNKGTYEFDKVIVAAGGGTRELFPNIKLEYAKGVMVLTKGIECNAIIAALFSKTRNERTKGGGIIPWPDGRILFGPSFEETEDPWDTSASESDGERVLGYYLDLLDAEPTVDEVFAGTRIKAPPKYDFKVEKRNNIIVLYGIDSPGFTAAPALAEHVVGLVR